MLDLHFLVQIYNIVHNELILNIYMSNASYVEHTVIDFMLNESTQNVLRLPYRKRIVLVESMRDGGKGAGLRGGVG